MYKNYSGMNQIWKDLYTNSITHPPQTPQNPTNQKNQLCLFCVCVT